MPGKPLTVKDVLYAVQFGGQRIEKARGPSMSNPILYRLTPSGTSIPKPVAEAVFAKHSKEIRND